MKISELKVRQDNVDIEAVVRDIEEPRTFNKFGREIRVANATIDDGSGSIKLTLWNQDIEKVAVGNKVKITSGFVNEFNGEKQLTAGRTGKIEVLEKGSFEQTEKAEEQLEKAETEKVEKEEIAEESESEEEQAEEGE